MFEFNDSRDAADPPAGLLCPGPLKNIDPAPPGASALASSWVLGFFFTCF